MSESVTPVHTDNSGIPYSADPEKVDTNTDDDEIDFYGNDDVQKVETYTGTPKNIEEMIQENENCTPTESEAAQKVEADSETPEKTGEMIQENGNCTPTQSDATQKEETETSENLKEEIQDNNNYSQTQRDETAYSRDITPGENECVDNKSSEKNVDDSHEENYLRKDKIDEYLETEAKIKNDSKTKNFEKNSKYETKSTNHLVDTKTPITNRTTHSEPKDVKFAKREVVNERRVFSETPKQYFYDTSPEDRQTDSDTTGGKSPVRLNRRKVFQNKRPQKSAKSPRSVKSSKSILRTDESKKQREPFSFLASIVRERQPTRSSDDNTVVSLPALNSNSEIKKVYVDDTEKLANKYPKRDKDFKLEFVYDKRPKYPSWYDPEKRLSLREEKVFKTIKNVYADHQRTDERIFNNAMKMDARIKQIEKLKKEEMREKRNKILETTLEQYEQLKEVREKFDVLCWYRNKTQYITPRVLEHEKLSRHMYGLPESLDKSQQAVKNLRRKNKRRQRPPTNRVKSQ